MTPPAPTFYVFHGDDSFSLRAEIRAMRAKLGDPGVAQLNTTTLDGKATTAEVLAAASTLPFLADRRLVIVEAMLSWLARKNAGKQAQTDLDTLVAALPTLPETTRLVFVETEILKDTHPILRLAARAGSNGYVRLFGPPPDRRDRRDETRWAPDWTADWITKQVKSYGAKIERQAAVALAAVVEQDLYAADSECAKLVTFVGTERAITEADVALLTPYVPEANIFDIVDALGRREGQIASVLIHRLLADPKQQPLALLSMINRQFRLLIQVREAIEMNRSPRDLPDLQRVSFLIPKLTEQARNFTLEQLEAIYRNLLESDYAIKTGKVSDVLALDLLVAGVSV